MTNNRKKITAVLSVILVLAIAIGATLAYLATTTDSRDNMFTFAQNIRAKLGEPNWDPDDATNLTPGYEVKKDPMITNVSDNGIDEYVAIQLTFQNGAKGTLTAAETVRLLNCLDITWNSDWSLKDGKLIRAGGSVQEATPKQVYVYNKVLAPGEVSAPVFSSVTIKSDIDDADYAWLAGMVMDHTDGCYTFGTHLDVDCTVKYVHHVNCNIYNLAGAEDVKDSTGAAIGGKNCNCKTAENHVSKPDKTCGTLIGTLASATCHAAPADSIVGFNINVKGSAVQAGVEGMTAWNTTDTVDNLVALFS